MWTVQWTLGDVTRGYGTLEEAARDTLENGDPTAIIMTADEVFSGLAEDVWLDLDMIEGV